MSAIEVIVTGLSGAAGRELDWQTLALCRGGGRPRAAGVLSERLDPIAAAEAFCSACAGQAPCLAGALARREPWGVWGGELLVNGKILAQKKKRGRPPKIRPEVPAARSA